MKKILSIIMLSVFIISSYYSVISATIVGPPCKYKINFNAGMDQPACTVPGGNCCGDV